MRTQCDLNLISCARRDHGHLQRGERTKGRRFRSMRRRVCLRKRTVLRIGTLREHRRRLARGRRRIVLTTTELRVLLVLVLTLMMLLLLVSRAAALRVDRAQRNLLVELDGERLGRGLSTLHRQSCSSHLRDQCQLRRTEVHRDGVDILRLTSDMIDVLHGARGQ
jgi:hypothetical protein